MAQQVTTRPNRRARRRVAALLTTAVAMVSIQLLAAAPAHANHRVSVTHQPPPAAVGGSPLRLVVAVDGCWVFCSPINVEAHYRTRDGRDKTVTQSLGSFGPQAAIFVIPGGDITRPAFGYFFEASQDFCWFESCHDAATRAPASGAYSVPVQ